MRLIHTPAATGGLAARPKECGGASRIAIASRCAYGPKGRAAATLPAIVLVKHQRRSRPTDAQFNVEKLALEKLAFNEKGSGILASHRFGMNWAVAVPSHPRQLGDPAYIFPVGLHRHSREHRLHVPRLEQNRIASGGRKPGKSASTSTPTSASWLNQVERFFGLITDDAIRRGVFRSLLAKP